ncbi:MAG: tetratricopeptide repeat protein [Candidatus Altimarinota bacterium]
MTLPLREHDQSSQKEVKKLMKTATLVPLDQDVEALLTRKLEQAFQLRLQSDYARSLQEFAEVLRIFPETLSPDMKGLIFLEMAQLSLWLGDYDKTEFFAQSVLQLRIEKDQQAYEFLARVAVAQFQFPLARTYLYKISSKSFVFSMIECLICIKLRDLKGAHAAIVSVFQKCEQEGTALPESNEFEVYQAYCTLLKGQSKEAVSSARRLQKKCANDPYLMLLLAEIFMTAGAYNEAFTATRKVESVFPDHDQVHALYAHIAYAREDFEASKMKAEASLRKNPSNHYACTILMKLALREGNYAEAERMGEAIVQESPEYSLGHANLGDLYFVQGKYDLAKREYSRTESLIDSKTKGALLRQARLKMMDGHYEDAARGLEDMIAQIHTYYDDAMCDLLVCYEHIDEPEKKQELLQKMSLRKVFSRRIDQMLRTIEKSVEEPI